MAAAKKSARKSAKKKAVKKPVKKRTPRPAKKPAPKPAEKLMHVGPQEQYLENSPTCDLEQGASAAQVTCYWNGQPFSQGAEICANHRIYRCLSGPNGPYWWNTGRAC